jgi:hypothetical protein
MDEQNINEMAMFDCDVDLIQSSTPEYSKSLASSDNSSDVCSIKNQIQQKEDEDGIENIIAKDLSNSSK